MLWQLFLSTFVSGVIGIGLGGLIGALIKKDSNKVASLLLSFAGGVMISVVCFSLILEALTPVPDTNTNVFIIIFGIILGYAVVYFLNYLIDKLTSKEVKKEENHPTTHDSLDELIHSDHLDYHRNNNDSKKDMLVAGLIMFAAIALHHLPEGITIGASAAISNDALSGSALIMSILIGLHNIPEGMAVSVPLISGGMKRWKAVLLTALSGVPTIIGAFIGYLIGDMGPLLLSLSLSFASGAMLYVVFGEIIPQGLLMYRSKAPGFVIILGMIVGLIIIFI